MNTLITLKDPGSAASEAFRTLRTNFLFAGLESPLQTVLITSAAVAEDKSTTAANLAVTLAQIGHRTILIDADLRRPTQHTLWGLKNERGLSSILAASDTSTDLPLQSVEVENLSVMTAGPTPSIPADLISARKLDDLLALLKARADYILFDAPPVLAVADAALLASKLDGLLLVARSGVTQRDHLEQAKKQLERVHVRVVGVALTNAPRDASSARY